MTERMSVDEFRERFGKTTKTTNLVGEPGFRWYADCGHEGWAPRLPKVCPRCGGRIAGSEFKRATAKQAEEYERRNP